MARVTVVHEPNVSGTTSIQDANVCEPPCRCADCQTTFYMEDEQNQPDGKFCYRNHLNDGTVTLMVSSYIQQIQTARTCLTRSLDQHADVIMSRWRKRSQDKRQALLKEVASELEESQWILFRYVHMKEGKSIPTRTLRRRRHLLLPWLNVEVLKTNPAVLFALLHFRTVYPPQDWAAFDCHNMEFAWAAGYLNVDFSSKCVVMYGARYGEVVKWEEGMAHRGDILGFPRARLVLEAQAYLMTLLRKIVDKILEGVDESSPARTEK